MCRGRGHGRRGQRPKRFRPGSGRDPPDMKKARLVAGLSWQAREAYSMPSFAFTIALTDCGLALPPVDFMTWPTNHPASVGFASA